MAREYDMIDDGNRLGPIEVFNVLERIMYNRRSRGNPYWNTLVISGYDSAADEPFLGQIDSQVKAFKLLCISKKISNSVTDSCFFLLTYFVRSANEKSSPFTVMVRN